MKATNVMRVLAVLGFVFFAASAWAQVTPPPTPSAPIDGGAVLLLVGAASYGYKAMKDRQKAGQ